jgi:hypothetical protein
MKNALKMNRLILAAVLILGWVQRSDALDSAKTVEIFAQKYQKAASAEEKRAVCIEAIDAGIISRGVNIEKIKKIFGKDFDAELKLSEDGSGYGIVDFIPTVSGKDGEAASHEGWYLKVEYDKKKLIQKYYLTNLHK